jgi:c-di-GMP-binding flagellar brake protein YcgR
MGDHQTGWMEKRQHERVTSTLKVQYRLVEGDAKKILKHVSYSKSTIEQVSELAQKSHVHHAVTRDLSIGGMALVGEQAFPKGAVVEVSLQLPHYKTLMKFVAEVVRSESFTEMQRTLHRAGLKILAINQEDIDHISRFLHIKKLQNELKDDLRGSK